MRNGTSKPLPVKGRGTVANPRNRYTLIHSVMEDDGWPNAADADNESKQLLSTEVRPEYVKSMISRNSSPDVPFEQSVNPYRGCEHGCVYCFARPTHAYWDLSPGLDFETKLFYKPNAVDVLQKQLEQKSYQCKPLVLGSNTDPYQPIEKFYTITRQILELLAAYRHPVSIITKGALIERDIELLSNMAKDGLCSVKVSVTTLDNELKNKLEPRAASPSARLRAVKQLTAAGIPTGILMAPIIPMINDSEIESVLKQCREAGAHTADYVFLRLPREVKDLFYEWLGQHYPDKAGHVISLIRQSREGQDYQSNFVTRMQATGVYADLIRQRFVLARKKLGFESREQDQLNCRLFNPSVNDPSQPDFFA